MLSRRGVINKRMQRVWGCKLPLKIKVFLWLACQGRLQTGVALKRRKWKGNERCVVCNVLETVDHNFFDCPLATFAWACLREALGWDRAPNSLQDFLDVWIPLGCKQYDLKLTLLAFLLALVKPVSPVTL